MVDSQFLHRGFCFVPFLQSEQYLVKGVFNNFKFGGGGLSGKTGVLFQRKLSPEILWLKLKV